ncbi:MAG TPA: glycosyltransferase family 2 protein [Terriglobales bacterium]|nr:glycosyltransferase family 2 protein [Terriglobales bacterium]
MKWLFWFSAAALAYTYAGYPAWLWLRSRYRRYPEHGVIDPKTVSIVMVVRNEAEVLDRKLRNLLNLDYPAELSEIIVVSDGSTDASEDILCEYSAKSRIRVLLNSEPRGKPSGLNQAIAIAKGEIVVFTDARQRIESGALMSLVPSFADPAVGCASGELMLGDPDKGEADLGFGLYWRIEKKIREMESISGSVVGATGAIYAVRRALLVPIPEGTILDDVYIPMQVARQGFRVTFDPSVRAWDTADLGGGREFARKVRTLSGNYQLLQLAPWLLSSSNPLRFEFISHKLMRLFAPIALCSVFISDLLIPQPFYRVILLLQIVFYTLSAIALTKLASGPLARVADAACTFVLLNSAATVAFVNFVIRRPVTWER